MQTNSDYLAELRKCQIEPDDTARLLCYDNAVTPLVAATDRGEVRIVDEAVVEKTKRGLFGFSLPDISLFRDRDGKDEQLDLLQSTITSVSKRGRNVLYFTIAEGDAVWRISGASRQVMATEPGDTVEFKKASLGSYFIRINGRTGEKGRRIR
ncbi:MAG: hypothetical protein WA908_06745 [Pontixanthobacter sp.]